jgi:hypothetical protein
VTTLLQRMVMRTRAPLSSAEPATRPLFAPGDPGLALGVAGIPEVSADAFAASPISGPATRPPLIGERVVGSQPGREISADASPPIRATPPGGRPGVERDRRQDAGEALGIAASLNQRGAATAASAGRDEGMSTATASPPTLPVSPTDSTEPPPQSPAERPPESVDRPPAPADAADRVRPRQQFLRPPANDPVAAAPATAPQVTISIGHIDVRAAPPPAPARSRPAFRPRVSLDEFLAASQDRRA